MLENIQIWAQSLGALALGNLVPAIILLVLGILVIRIVMAVVGKALAASKLEKAAHSLIKSLVSVVLYLILGLMVADKLGIDVTSIIALASVLTLAVSLAIQNALANVIGGFTLLYTHPFHSGDFVEIAGKSGTVQEIGMSYTVLATPDNKLISIPNSSVVAGDIVNYTVTGTRRLDIKVRAAYCVPTQKVIDALLQAGTVDNVLLDPAPFAAIENYGENAIEYVLRVWTKTDDYWDVNYAINQNVKNIFDAQDIKMSYPHMYVHMK
ncbi:MAG: mechanosensitive ion channel family protein [Oscillospiraceae bacterium]|nr:mechanosensitive ion channel family protein [Oscillospiraceae bacterium]